MGIGDTLPDEKGRFGEFGGRFVPETLMHALEELEADELAKAVLGETFHKTFIDYKRSEWLEYCLDVTPWERDKYLRLW